MTLLVRNRLLRGVLRLIDFLPQARGTRRPIKRILLSNLAHLGDVVIATSVVAPLREAFPDAQIGFLCGSWAVDLLDVDHIHVVDHYKHDRSSPSLWRYLRQKRRVVRELRDLDYDVAIDLYYYFGNAAHIFAQAHIPTRIGFTSGGLGRFYTHPVQWHGRGCVVSDYYPQLLERLGIEAPTLAGLLPQVEVKYPGFTILHPGAGDSKKRWSGWRELVEELREAHTLCVTGCGERHLTDPIAQLGVHNFADRLSIREWIGLICGARLVIAVDSAIVHIAAACGIPCIAIYQSQEIADEWSGNSEHCYPLVRPTAAQILALQRSIVSNFE